MHATVERSRRPRAGERPPARDDAAAYEPEAPARAKMPPLIMPPPRRPPRNRVARLPLAQRLVVAEALDDHADYDYLRDRLAEQGVTADAMPSSDSLLAYRQSDEYREFCAARVDDAAREANAALAARRNVDTTDVLLDHLLGEVERLTAALPGDDPAAAVATLGPTMKAVKALAQIKRHQAQTERAEVRLAGRHRRWRREVAHVCDERGQREADEAATARAEVAAYRASLDPAVLSPRARRLCEAEGRDTPHRLTREEAAAWEAGLRRYFTPRETTRELNGTERCQVYADLLGTLLLDDPIEHPELMPHRDVPPPQRRPQGLEDGPEREGVNLEQKSHFNTKGMKGTKGEGTGSGSPISPVGPISRIGPIGPIPATVAAPTHAEPTQFAAMAAPLAGGKTDLNRTKTGVTGSAQPQTRDAVLQERENQRNKTTAFDTTGTKGTKVGEKSARARAPPA